MHAWLDEQRRIAMQQGGACKIKINTTNATLDPTDPTITLPDSSTTRNTCASRESLLIQESVKNGAQIQLSKSSIKVKPGDANQLEVHYATTTTSTIRTSFYATHTPEALAWCP